MLKTNIKSALLTSFVLAIVACTKTTIPNNTNPSIKDSFQDLDKEYNKFIQEISIWIDIIKLYYLFILNWDRKMIINISIFEK